MLLTIHTYIPASISPSGKCINFNQVHLFLDAREGSVLGCMYSTALSDVCNVLAFPVPAGQCCRCSILCSSWYCVTCVMNSITWQQFHISPPTQVCTWFQRACAQTAGKFERSPMGACSHYWRSMDEIVMEDPPTPTSPESTRGILKSLENVDLKRVKNASRLRQISTLTCMYLLSYMYT